MFKTSSPLSRRRASQVKQRLRDLGKFAKRNGADSFVFKTGASPELDLRRHRGPAPPPGLRHRCLCRGSPAARGFAPVVPPMEAMEAPVFTQARLADCTFPRFTDLKGMDALGTETPRRGLEHWWIDVNLQQLFGARS